MPTDVADLVAAAREGDREAFDELVRATYADAFTLACRLTGDEDDARDVVQEAYLRAYRGLRRFRGDAQFSTWMYRIALNVAISQVRTTTRRGRYVVPLDEDLHDRTEDGLDAVVKEDRVRALHAFIMAQNDLDRALLLLYLEEQPHQGIADVLGISTSNVGTRIGRLKQRMREALRIPEHYS